MHRKSLALAATLLLLLEACGGANPSASSAPSASGSAPSAASPSGRPGSPASSAAAGGSVSFTRFAEADMVFHPVEAQSNQYMLYYLVFDTLATLDLKDTTLQTIKPRMAESWDDLARCHDVHVPSAQGHQVARRHTVHGQGRRLHGDLGSRERQRLHRLPAGMVLAQGSGGGREGVHRCRRHRCRAVRRDGGRSPA